MLIAFAALSVAAPYPIPEHADGASAGPTVPVLDEADPAPSRGTTIVGNTIGVVCIAGGTAGAVLSTGCSSAECGRLYGGALGLAPISAGSLLISYLTAFRGEALHGERHSEKSVVGWVGAGLVSGGIGFVTLSLVGVDTRLESWAVPGLVLVAAGWPLVVAQGVRNGHTRRSAEGRGRRVLLAPTLGEGGPGLVLVGRF